MRKFYLGICVVLLAFSMSLAAVGCSKQTNRVVFMLDGQVYSTYETKGNEAIPLPKEPEKENYLFDGWYRDNGTFSIPFRAEEYLNAKLEENVAYYGKWIEDPTKKYYTVSFETDGNGEVPAQSVLYGDKVSKPPILQSGTKFLSAWYKDVDRTKKWDFATDPVTENITLYGVWKKPITLDNNTAELSIDLSLFQTYDSADLTYFGDSNFDRETGIYTVFPTYDGKQVNSVKITGLYGKADESGRMIKSEFQNFAIYFSSTWNTDVSLTLENIAFSAGDGANGLDLSSHASGKALLTVNGEVSIKGGNGKAGSPEGCDAVNAKELLVEGKGYLTVYGGNGSDGNTAENVFEGSGGGMGIRAGDLSLNLKSVFGYGGNGGNGSAGNGRKGFGGGNGGNGITVMNSLLAKNTSVSCVGGNGGNGGKGGTGEQGNNGYAHKTDSSTRRGGTGITGYNGGDGGTGGTGGIGGRGGDGYMMQYNGLGGNGGTGGTGGNAYYGQTGCNVTPNLSTVIQENGNNGVVGTGGAGGGTGSDGNGGWTTDSGTKRNGSQGNSGVLKQN